MSRSRCRTTKALQYRSRWWRHSLHGRRVPRVPRRAAGVTSRRPSSLPVEVFPDTVQLERAAAGDVVAGGEGADAGAGEVGLEVVERDPLHRVVAVEDVDARLVQALNDPRVAQEAADDRELRVPAGT